MGQAPLPIHVFLPPCSYDSQIRVSVSIGGDSDAAFFVGLNRLQAAGNGARGDRFSRLLAG